MAFQVFPPHPARFSYGGNWAALKATDAGDAEAYGSARGRFEPRIVEPNHERQDHGSAGDRHAPMMTPDEAA